MAQLCAVWWKSKIPRLICNNALDVVAIVPNTGAAWGTCLTSGPPLNLLSAATSDLPEHKQLPDVRAEVKKRTASR